MANTSNDEKSFEERSTGQEDVKFDHDFNGSSYSKHATIFAER